MTKTVVCAWLINSDGQVLLTQRRADAHLALLWEFPGGKVEPGETLAGALARELREEIGVEAEVGEELGRVVHHYEKLSVELVLLAVNAWRGEVRPLEVRDFRWVAPEWLDVHADEMPPADRPLVATAKQRLAAKEPPR